MWRISSTQTYFYSIYVRSKENHPNQESISIKYWWGKTWIIIRRLPYFILTIFIERMETLHDYEGEIVPIRSASILIRLQEFPDFIRVRDWIVWMGIRKRDKFQGEFSSRNIHF